MPDGESSVFRGGIPYRLSVERLEQAFPYSKLTEGMLIPTLALTEVLEEAEGTPRYYQVINSWIAGAQNHHGKVMVWSRRQGIKVLPPAEVLSDTEKRVFHKIRLTVKAARRFRLVDRARLEEPLQRRFDHQSRNASLLMTALNQTRKEMAKIELPKTESLPKRIVSKS